MKVKLFTHTDMDGISCRPIASMYYDDVSVEYCDYNNINSKFKKYLNSEEYKKFDKTYITDISISDEVAAQANALAFNLVLLDHHKSAEGLNKYDWASVSEIDNQGNPTCGTKLFAEYLRTVFNASNMPKRVDDDIEEAIATFANYVCIYDTWQWKNSEYGYIAKSMNDIFHIRGRDWFVTWVLSSFTLNRKCPDIFEPTIQVLLDVEHDRIAEYIDKKNKTMKKYYMSFNLEDVSVKYAGVVFADRYISELGNALCEQNPNIDYVIIINPDYSLSFRTIKDDVDVSEIAKMFSGGGHPKAAGAPLSEDVKDVLVRRALQDSYWDKQVSC